MDKVTAILLLISFLMIVAIGFMIYFLETEDDADYPIIDILIVENGRGRSDEQVSSVKEFAPWANIQVVDLTGSLTIDDQTIAIHRTTGTMADVFMRADEFASSGNMIFLGDTTFPKKSFKRADLYYRDKKKVSQVYQDSLTQPYVDPSVQPLCVVQISDLEGLTNPSDYVSHLIFIEDGIMDQAFTQDVFVTPNAKAQTAQFDQAADKNSTNIFFTLHSSFEGANEVITEWLETEDYLR